MRTIRILVPICALLLINNVKAQDEWKAVQTIKLESKNVSFEWFTSVVDGKEVLNGKVVIGDQNAAESHQIRVCLEFAIAGSELEWREQAIFHGDVEQ
jgi:hypothetical protein